MTNPLTAFMDLPETNALHAATTWLQRIGAAEACAAVVTIAPRTGIAVWTPGAQTLQQHDLDDAVREVLEATAPAVDRVLQMLSPHLRHATLESIGAGARLEVLLFPQAEGMSVRLSRGGNTQVLATLGRGPMH